MTTLGWIALGFVVALLSFVILEGKRQERKYGKTSGSPNLMGVGMLELQKHLQADRRVDVLQQQEKDEETEIVEDQSSEE